jgi:hypothetical protein
VKRYRAMKFMSPCGKLFHLLFLQSSEQPQQPIQDREGMRRAAGNEKINGNDGGGSVEYFRMVDKRSAGDGTSAYGNGNFRLGHGVPGFLQGQLHAFRNAAGDEQAIRVTGRGDELNSETAEIPSDSAQHVGVGFAGTTPAGADLAQTERTAKEFAQFLVQSSGQADLFAAGFTEHEVFTAADGHAVVAGLGDGARRTGFHTSGAKEAASKVEGHRFAGVARNGLGRADGHASVAASSTANKPAASSTVPAPADGVRIRISETLSLCLPSDSTAA